MASKRPDSFVPQCPRCGYDQSGLIATWESSCTLDGLCSECGYAFRWREVLNPEERRLPGLVEHCRLKLVPLVAFRTLAWALLPWVLWRRVKLHHEVRPWRLLAWACVVLVGWHVVNAGLFVLERWSWYDHFVRTAGAMSFRYVSPPTIVGGAIQGLAWPFLDLSVDMLASSPPWQAYVMIYSWNSKWLIVAGTALAFPMMLMILSGSRAINGVRKGHVLRAAVYSLAWVVVPLAWHTFSLLHSIQASFSMPALNWMTRYNGLPGIFNEPRRWTAAVVLLWIVVYGFGVMKRGWAFRSTLVHWLVLTIVSLAFGLVGAVLINSTEFGMRFLL